MMARKPLPPGLMPEHKNDGTSDSGEPVPDDFYPDISVQLSEIDFQGYEAPRSQWRKRLPRFSDASLFPQDPDDAAVLGLVYDITEYVLGLSARARNLDNDDIDLILTQLQAVHRDKYPPTRLDLTQEQSKKSSGSVKLKAKPSDRWAERDLNRKEDPAEFTRRVYKKWLAQGFDRKLLRDADPELYRALSVWVHRHPDDIINGLYSKGQQMDEIIKRLSSELSEDELRRLGYAIDARFRRKKQ